MKKSYIGLAFFIFLLGCTKKDAENSPVQTEYVYENSLSKENDDFLASASVPTPSPRDVLGPDGLPLGVISGTGTNPNTQSSTSKTTAGVDRNTFVRTLLQQGLAICAQKTTKVYPDEGVNKPAHNGIAYALGSNSFLNRKFPLDGNALHKKYSVYGVDCSGLLIYLIGKAGITMPDCKANNFNSVFSATIKNDTNFNNMRLCVLGQLPQSKIESGDIITWAGHIGIVYVNADGTKCLINSHGTGNPTSQSDQDKNLGFNRGVHTVSLNTILGQSWFGSNYTVSRFRAVGDAIEGGLLFYLDETGKHGIVAAPTDQSSAMEWNGGLGGFTSGTSFDVGKGPINTTLIVNSLGNMTPAYLCDQLVLNGYNDWYLPSLDELNLVYFRLKVNGYGSFNATGYYSSSDYDFYAVWSIGFGNNVGGNQYKAPKTFPGPPTKFYNGVRAVRSF